MKKLVHYDILDDMKKYIKYFNPNNYQSSNTTDPSVVSYVRNYYDAHLPVDVTAWMRVNIPKESLIYAQGLHNQVSFVRDILCNLLYSTYEELCNNPPLVISTHCSKSLKLPVFQLKLKKYGIEIVLRYNFYDWKVSVKSDKPLNFDYMGLFNPTKKIPYFCCEGFPKDKVFGSYEQNNSQFTIEIDSYYNLYTFFFLLKNYLEIKRE